MTKSHPEVVLAANMTSLHSTVYCGSLAVQMGSSDRKLREKCRE